MIAPASNIALKRVHSEQSVRTIATEKNCSRLGWHLELVLGLVLHFSSRIIVLELGIFTQRDRNPPNSKKREALESVEDSKVLLIFDIFKCQTTGVLCKLLEDNHCLVQNMPNNHSNNHYFNH